MNEHRLQNTLSTLLDFCWTGGEILPCLCGESPEDVPAKFWFTEEGGVMIYCPKCEEGMFIPEEK